MPDFVVTTSPDEFTIVDKTEDWVIYANDVNEITVELVAVALNDAALAVAAAAAAAVSADEAAASAASVAGDAAAAAASAAAALVSANNAATSEMAAGAAQTAAEAAQAAAEAAVASIGTAVTDAQDAAAAAIAAAAAAATSEGNAQTAQTAAEAAQAAAEAAAAIATSVIPTGGTTGQALVKASNTDYDYAWATISGIGDMTKAVYDPNNIAADVFARANHTGTQLASTISDFNTAADARVSAAIGATVQAYSANLTTWAGIAPSANVISFNSAANYAAMKALLDLEIGIDVQAYSANLTTFAGIAPSANVQSLLAAADYAAMRTLLNVANGADVTATAWAPAVVAATAKTTPVDADNLAITDSAASNVIKKVTWANIKATLKTYFDTLYPLLAGVNTFTARQVVAGGGTGNSAMNTATSGLGELEVRGNGTGAAMMTFHRPSSHAAYFGLDTDNKWKIGGWSTGAVAYEVILSGTTQTLSGKTLVDPVITGTIREDVFTITDAAGFAVDPTNGSVQRVTLGASRTPVPANWDDGESVTLFVADGTAFTITWTSFPVVWKGGIAPTLATSGWSEINITKENGVYRGVHIGDFAS